MLGCWKIARCGQLLGQGFSFYLATFVGHKGYNRVSIHGPSQWVVHQHFTHLVNH